MNSMIFFYIFMQHFTAMVKEKSYTSDNTKELLTGQRKLVLYNDDHNTFDHVIDTLIECCEHDLHQAEQCALITHFKGKCGVKEGSFEELKPIHREMGRRDLTVEIQ
jgi:ATP-dependent Clp protease adaptor protein ClpS